MTKTIGVGIIGLGTVGGGTAKVLMENAAIITARTTAAIELRRVCVRNVAKAQDKLTAMGLDPAIVTDKAEELLLDPAVDIVVEVMGGIEGALAVHKAAIAQGKSVITANKDLIATYGQELFAMAAAAGVDLFYEAAVAGGIPIIKALKESLAGNQVKKIMGIVNGTTNYILSRMSTEGVDYEPVLKQAQELGYAEADPTSDVGGHDAARKMAILASLAFNSQVTEEMVDVQGITAITQLDIAYAKQLGYTIKLLGVAKDAGNAMEVWVAPVMIPENHPLAAVNDAFNAVFVEGYPLGTAMFYGQGAGEFPTASAVVGDIIQAAVNLLSQNRGKVGCAYFADKKVQPMAESVNKYYIRLTAPDRTRVLAAIADAIGQSGVSIRSMLQTRQVSETQAEIVIITHGVRQGNMDQAVANLTAIPEVDVISNVIRVDDEWKNA